MVHVAEYNLLLDFRSTVLNSVYFSLILEGEALLASKCLLKTLLLNKFDQKSTYNYEWSEYSFVRCYYQYCENCFHQMIF